MWVVVYIALTAFVTWKISRFYWSFKFKHDVKFIQAVLQGQEFIVQNQKGPKKKVLEVEDEE